MGIQSSDLRQINRLNIYKAIYHGQGIAKQELAVSLGISLPTISKCLNELENDRLIQRKNGEFSTGGRPASKYYFNSIAKISIGVELLSSRVNIAAVDLVGNIISENSLDLEFDNSDIYYNIFFSWVNRFISSLCMDPNNILGITIAIQGLISVDGKYTTFDKLLNNLVISRSSFQQYFSLPVSLIHDAEAAAIAELWHFSDINNAIFLSLNPNLGSAIIVNGNVIHGNNSSSGVLEHLLLHSNGEKCYCGKSGCADTTCSGKAIMKASGEDIQTFFEKKENGSSQENIIWENYLHELSIFVENIRVVIDGDLIIGGLLSSYFSQSDFQKLETAINQSSIFTDLNFTIYKGFYGSKATLVGAALVNIKDYLSSENLL